jgi:hypothetical protein
MIVALKCGGWREHALPCRQAPASSAMTVAQRS